MINRPDHGFQRKRIFLQLLPPTGVDHCTTGYLTHCPADRRALSGDAELHPSDHPREIGTWAAASGLDGEGNLLPNLVVVKVRRHNDVSSFIYQLMSTL